MSYVRYLGPIHHPAIGIRLPDILLKGILEAFKERNVAGTLMLSFVRETAPEFVINAPPGKYPITMGHTGTSIKEYMTKAAEAAEKYEVIVEIEADHITVTSPTKAVKRISGVEVEYGLSESELREALDFVKAEIDEAIKTGQVRFFTIDTCELVNLKVDKLSDEEIKRLFEESFTDGEGKEIIRRYVGKDFTFIGASRKPFRLSLDEMTVMRLALKYKDSLRLAKEIYDYIKARMKEPFGVEVAFDELPGLTQDVDLLFYLRELWELGIRADFIAPNVGFEKRQDYRGDLNELRERVERLAAIARSFGTLLSFHSGSGSSPYSGKGPGTYEALLRATGENLKYKISGVYIELLFDLMASYPKDSRPRKVFDTIFDEVYNYLKRELELKGPLASHVLQRQISMYEEEVKKGVRKPRDSRADFFRYYSFLALNMRDESGKRYLREMILELYEEDKEFRERYDREVKALTLRLIEGLRFADNVKLLKSP